MCLWGGKLRRNDLVIMAVFLELESWTHCVPKISVFILVIFFRHCCSESFEDADFINNTVEAVLGEIAQFPCYTKPETNDFVTVVLWFRDNCSSPFCNYDNRKGSRFNADPEWNGTVSFRLEENEDFSNLTLKPVKRSHQGLYRCRVDFKYSRARFYFVNLIVIVPPEKLDIRDDKNVEVRNGHIGPYKENTTVRLLCLAYGGLPPPRVKWFQGTALLSDSSQILTNGTVQNVLVLEKLTRNHLYAVYDCQAANNKLKSLSRSVTINMTLPPQSVKLLGADKSMSAGRAYEISCHVYGANPSPVIRWSRGNEKLKNIEKSDSNDGNLTISRLTFIPEPEDDGKTLSCNVDSAASAPGQFFDSRKLFVTYKPIAKIELPEKLNRSNIVEGMDVYFECKIKSNLPVEKVNWKHGSSLLRHNQTAGLLISNQTLVLQKISRHQSGLYSCVAINEEGVGESNAEYLNVKFAPVCYSSSVTEYGADRGEKVKVLCEVEANPPNVSFIWEFNNKSGSLSLPTGRFSYNGTRSYLEFQPSNENDYGLLNCRARNIFGEQKQPCSYRIYPAGKPSIVSNCSVLNKTSTSLSIKCYPGFDGGSRQQFIVEVYDASTGAKMLNLTSEDAEFFVNGLEHDLTYDIIIYASNSKGRSMKIEFKETLRQERNENLEKFVPILDLSPLLTILMVIVGLLILITCCIVISMRSQDSKRRKKPYAYNSKDSLEKNPDIIPNKDDVSCTLEITNVKEEKRCHSTKQTDISLILQNSYGTDMNIDFISHQEDYKPKMYKKKTSSLRRLNDVEVTYAACDQPCPPFVTQETPLLSSNRIPFISEGQHSVRCCIHGLSRSTSIS